MKLLCKVKRLVETIPIVQPNNPPYQFEHPSSHFLIYSGALIFSAYKKNRTKQIHLVLEKTLQRLIAFSVVMFCMNRRFVLAHFEEYYRVFQKKPLEMYRLVACKVLSFSQFFLQQIR